MFNVVGVFSEPMLLCVVVYKLLMCRCVDPVTSELMSVKVGDHVRVKPSITTPKYKWGSVTRDSIGTVTGQFEMTPLTTLQKLQTSYDPLSGTTQVSQYQKDKPFWILLKQT